ncbi:N-acetylmuramoyl-L-alanine amidase, partial [Desulfosporosinus sp. PR]|uniref:N-acetylmuramoyl-L-alanine amidase family protein n=1 Tax=Candidatus Desulfosporosinus nitrosoreducens TaxID=3401928 RepID=UPI0027FB6527
MKLCLDPGHGGYDPGACGNGLREKDITLDICLRLKPLLEFNGVSVCLTRDGDYAPGHLENQLNAELNYRSAISNNFGADLFVSVHVNSGGGTGQEILVAGMGGKAEAAAGKCLYYIQQVSRWPNRGVKAQNVSVLGSKTNAPAYLTENGFIDSVTDTAKLKDPNFRQSLAVAHAKGICDYFGVQYREGGTDMLEVAVLLYTKEDYWAGTDVSAKNGNCALFIRPDDHSVPKDAMSAKTLYIVGGGSVGHSNEVLLSGNSKYDTAAAV